MIYKTRTLLVAALVVLLSSALVIAAGSTSFKAKMTGKEEVPAVKTRASGIVDLKVNEEGTEISYKLTVRNIRDAAAAHIHEGTEGNNGGPVANLFTGPAKKGRFSGTLSEGTITSKDLSGSLYGKTIEDLVRLIRSGGAYVNVHTAKNPDGEIRGQLK